jgi:hypothetical protein
VSKQESDTAFEITVERVDDLKVFQLYGLHFPVLPAEIITGPYPNNIMMNVVRKDGAVLPGRVYRPMDYPNGVSGGNPHFILRGLGLEDISPRTLNADSFEEGDVLKMEEMHWFFRVDLLDNLEVYFKRHRAFHRRYKDIREAYRRNLRDSEGKHLEGEAANTVMRKFVDDMFALLNELKDLPHWPTVVSLEMDEQKAA